MRAHVSNPIVLAFALAACSPSQDVASVISNHDPASAETIAGIERLGDGPYRAGQTEHFRAVVAGEVLEYRWEANGGELEPMGAEVLWTLPEGRSSWLRLIATLPGGEERAGDFLFFTTAAGDIDPSSDATGNYCDLAFDATDKPHLIYSNDSHPSIWYATYQSGAWTTEFVDGQGFDVGGRVIGTISIAVDASDRPHLAYILRADNQYQVYYAHKSASGWIRERVDTTVPFNSSNYVVAIALDPANNQRPTILYSTYDAVSTNYAVAIGYRTGAGTWANESGLANEYVAAGGLAFTASGVAHFTIRGYYTNRIIPGTWPPFSEDPRLAGSSVESARLALDAADQPIIIYPGGVAHKIGNTWIESAIEYFSLSYFDIAFDGIRPHVALVHGNHLELVTTDASGYWQYTDVGSADNITPNIAIDATGQPHVCYRKNGAVAFQ